MSWSDSLSGRSLFYENKSQLPMGTSHASAGSKVIEPLSQAESDSNKLSNFHQGIHFDCVRKNIATI